MFFASNWFSIMNILISIFFIIKICSLVITEEDLNPDEYNVTWMHFSNGSDLPEIVLLTEPPKARFVNEMSNLINFELYTSENIQKPHLVSWFLPQTRHKRDIWEQIDQNFNPKLNTKFIVHGWKSNTQSDTIQAIKNEYLKREPYNIIAVNWAEMAGDIYYLRPARYTEHVGRAIAELINLLVERKKVDSRSIHLIGHSLGAHIMGFAGSYAKYRVSRITGLDPARPVFEGITGPEGHLDKTDADFVDVIHSCAGYLGFRAPIGDIDFYPNGGTAPQPGCSGIAKVFAACSHGRSHRFFAESINSEKGFYAYPCKDWDDFKSKDCLNNEPVLMGDQTPFNATGIYYLKTNEEPIFAVGKERE